MDRFQGDNKLEPRKQSVIQTGVPDQITAFVMKVTVLCVRIKYQKVRCIALVHFGRKQHSLSDIDS